MPAHRIDIDELIALRREASGVDLSSRRRVMTDLAGSRLSGFRGRGMDFEEHRAYQPGDEARTIDWRVTARSGKLHVRVYREERERPVLLAVDLRPAMWFGTRRCYKAVLAARAAALCAWSAATNGDRVGGACLSGAGLKEVRTAAGPRAVLRLIHALAGDPPAEPPAHTLADLLRLLLRTVRPGSLVGVFSDFRGLGKLEQDLLLRLGQRAELIAGFVYDPLDAELPPPDIYPLARQAPGSPPLLDTTGSEERLRWRAAHDARRSALSTITRRSHAHWLELCTANPLMDSLEHAFGRRRLCA